MKDQFRDGVALDIGANIGNHALFFAPFFRQIHAFEPNPSTYHLLSFNARAPGNIVTYPLGLGDETGTIHLFENLDNMGAASMKHVPADGAGGADVPVKRLDELDIDLSGLRFVNIDVEGFEANVLRGAEGALRAHQPVVVLEQHQSEFKDGTTESISLLRALGYGFCWPESRDQGVGAVRRRLRLIRRLMRGDAQEHDIVTADTVPVRTYSMLIAVPQAPRGTLGMGAA